MDIRAAMQRLMDQEDRHHVLVRPHTGFSPPKTWFFFVSPAVINDWDLLCHVVSNHPNALITANQMMPVSRQP